ncbi:glycosyltransferase [Neobacillus mesonae]|uniref:glycosyltransferase n=1 Tax=Neobacillus mesonae TaxID=1193713 RepID=UPI00203E1976|nr:glycosyltransferase [Neobacillus mesonae]MCM3569379.1 glycosyltransferase [Neobacillus mesonae]
MKILFVVGEFPKLSETFILNQITGLIDQGHSVTILAQKPNVQENVHEEVKKYNLVANTIYYDYPQNKEVRIKRAIKLFPKTLLKNPIKTVKSINMFKYGKEVLSFRPLLCLVKLLKNKQKLNYDIIHCHFGPNGILATILKDIGVLDGRVYTTFHGLDMTTYLNVKGSEVYNYLFKTGDKFLPISYFWKSKLESLGCDPIKISVHSMGVNLEKFDFIKPNYELNKIKIISVARLVEKKGIHYGIDAVTELIKKGYNIELSIIGDGPLKQDLEVRITENNMNNHIKILGWKTQEEIIQLLKKADLFLAPSITSKDGDMEGIPVVLMEAMAMGKPIISTYHSGIPELIIDNENGWLVPERDVESLSKKIAYAIDNHINWEQIGKAARRTVSEKHDINKLNKRLEKIFQ